MATKLDQVSSYILALDDDEINTIVSALYDAGEDDLATEIYDECFGVDECECGPEPQSAESAEELILRILREVRG